MTIPIRIPLINPNEPEALLASLYLEPGQKVAIGDLVCSLETTKSTQDLLAEAEGYLVGVKFAIGEMVSAGDVLGYIAETPDWVPPVLEPSRGSDVSVTSVPDGLRITQPALFLAQQRNLDLTRLPKDVLIIEKTLRELLEKPAKDKTRSLEGVFDPTAILIYGGGGHGKSVLELVEATGTYRVVGFVDDGIPKGELILGNELLGGSEILPELFEGGVRLAVNAVGGIGDLAIRRVVFQRLLKAGFGCPAVAHPSAVLEPSASLSPGVQVFPLAYVGSQVQTGFGTIINTGAIVSHECVLGELVNISPGAILAGDVKVGAGALVGMGVTVNLGVRIGENTRIGNGATVKSDVPDGGIVPAGSVWPRR